MLSFVFLLLHGAMISLRNLDVCHLASRCSRTVDEFFHEEQTTGDDLWSVEADTVWQLASLVNAWRDHRVLYSRIAGEFRPFYRSLRLQSRWGRVVESVLFRWQCSLSRWKDGSRLLMVGPLGCVQHVSIVGA